MSSGIIDTIKKVALKAWEATKPTQLLFGKVISTEPVKVQIGEHLTLTREFLVINGQVFNGDNVALIRCQGGQKYVVLGTRTVYTENTIYVGGTDTTSTGWQFPFRQGYTVTSAFGVRRGSTTHKGVDIVGKNSKHIYPVNSGVVISTGYDSDGWGNYVIIKHSNDYWSVYAHMSSIYVKYNQTVTHDTILGVEGSTGHSTGSHLHLEIRRGSNSSNNTIDPLSFLSSN